MKAIIEKSKPMKIEFAKDKFTDPSGVGLSCHPPSKLDYSGLKATTAAIYLEEWSNNKEANAKPKVKSELPKHLGLQNATPVIAGTIQCDGEEQNIIFVNSRQAFARYGENAYLVLYNDTCLLKKRRFVSSALFYINKIHFVPDQLPEGFIRRAPNTSGFSRWIILLIRIFTC
jgi:hypothetical protein